jgi:hypothetical protein
VSKAGMPTIEQKNLSLKYATFSFPSTEDSKAKRKEYIAKRDSTKVGLYKQNDLRTNS